MFHVSIPCQFSIRQILDIEKLLFCAFIDILAFLKLHENGALCFTLVGRKALSLC